MSEERRTTTLRSRPRQQTANATDSTAAIDALVVRHLRVGWWSLFAFAALGLCLEYLHAMKLPFYLAEASESRRLMWTLGHAHGTGLAAINILFAVTLRAAASRFESQTRSISRWLVAATIVLPTGFFLGGVGFFGGDPGIGGIGIPVGAMLLLIALGLIATRFRR